MPGSGPFRTIAEYRESTSEVLAAFGLVEESKAHGARVALFGRTINASPFPVPIPGRFRFEYHD